MEICVSSFFLSAKMAGNFLTAFLLILTQVSILFPVSCHGFLNTYRGAVVEYHPSFGANHEETMNQNVKNYVKFMELAKSKGADIIVFPEQGLMSSIASPIPEPSQNIAPCDSIFKTTQAVKDLSEASKKNRIYSVVNLLEKRTCEPDDKNCPPSGFYTLNTNVVFDRQGVVVARYSKYNIYTTGEERINEPEFSFFDTDFGVRFGTFVCFDILFPIPTERLIKQYGIKDFVYTNMWYSELPFLTALQMQRGWAETHNVNLLSSGVNRPIQGSSGSGIYNGKFGHLTYIMTETAKSKLLVADIPKVKDCSDVCQQRTPATSPFIQTPLNSNFSAGDTPQTDLTLIRENLNVYTTEVITPGKEFEKTICSNDLCCDFKADIEAWGKDSKNYTWRAMVFDGVRRFGGTHFAAVQSCGVVACNGSHVQNCTDRVEKIPDMFKVKVMKIKGNFKLRNSFQIPTTLTDGKALEPLPAYKYEFLRTEKENNAEVSMDLLWPVTDLYAFGIWGRDFTRDGDLPISVGSATVSVPVLLATLFGFVLFAR